MHQNHGNNGGFFKSFVRYDVFNLNCEWGEPINYVLFINVSFVYAIYLVGLNFL